MVVRFSIEADYWATTWGTCRLLWVKSLLKEYGYSTTVTISLYYDNMEAIFIASNPVFHEITKHIEFDWHFVRDAILSRISTPWLEDQVVYFYSLSCLRGSRQTLCGKLGMIDMFHLEKCMIYILAWGVH